MVFRFSVSVALATAVCVAGCGAELAAGEERAISERDDIRPWSHNTGPTNRSALSSMGSTKITTNGAVLEDFDMRGRLTIEADNVTVRNFVIDAGGGTYGIWVKPGVSGFVAEDGEVRDADSAMVYAQGQITARRLHIHDGASDGFKLEGSGSLVEYSFIERLGSRPEAHADANQTFGGSNITFRYNNFYVPNAVPGFHTNRIQMLHDGFSNFIIENNWMEGGNYTVTCLPGVTYRDNFFGRDYKYGVKASSGCVWTNNRFEDTGEVIP
jgi:hypothetical protein